MSSVFMKNHIKSDNPRRSVLNRKENQTHTLVVNCIETALFRLMNEKPFDDITVSEVIESSGVSRMGFYRNFMKKEDVIGNFFVRIFTNEIEKIKKERPLNFGARNVVSTCTEKFLEYREQTEVVIKSLTLEQLYPMFEKCFFALAPENAKEKPMHFYSSYLFLSELFMLVIKWVQGGYQETPAELTKMYGNILKLRAKQFE